MSTLKNSGTLKAPLSEPAIVDVRADSRITAQKGAASGLAPLNSSSIIPSTNLPPLSVQQLIGSAPTPWRPADPIGPELWATTNFKVASGYNSTTLTPSLTGNGVAQTLNTGISGVFDANTDRAYRLSFDVTSMPAGSGGAGVSLLLTDSGGTAVTGSAQQYVATRAEVPNTGHFYFEFKPEQSALSSSSMFVLRLELQNNVTTGNGTLQIGNVSLREIPHATRPIMYGNWSSQGMQIYTSVWDKPGKAWRVFKNTLGADSVLATAPTNITANTADQFGQYPTFDPAFVKTGTSVSSGNNNTAQTRGSTGGHNRPVHAGQQQRPDHGSAEGRRHNLGTPLQHPRR